MRMIEAQKPPENLEEIKPGKYEMSNHAYHSMKYILSSSGARSVLRNSARFNWERYNPQPPTTALETGTLWHDYILENGRGIEWVEAENFLTKAAKAERDAIRERGNIPALVKEKETLEAVLKAVMGNPDAAALLNPFEGEAEGSYIVEYQLDNGEKCLLRTRPDWLTIQDGKLKIVDYKTTENASKEEFTKSVVKYGYHQQAAWYEETLTRAFKCKRSEVEFWFIAQEKNPPFSVGVYRLDDAAILEGETLNHRAINKFAWFEKNGWPEYYETQILSLPNWAYSKEA